LSNNKPEINNPSKVYALFYSFFLIPLMITIFGVLFFFLFKMLTYEKQDPYHLLNNINSGSLTKRWQSAYELSNLMSDINKIPTDQLFVNQMIAMYKKSIHDDSRVRTYLALAMGQTKNIEFCSHLINGLEDKDLENRIAAIKSVGMIECKDAVNKLHQILNPVNNNQERLASVISIGMLGNVSSIDLLVSLLEDEEANIRWDTAISLYKMNNFSGNYILEKLLNREYYSNYSEVDINEIDNAILTVLALVSENNHSDFKNELEKLAKDEKNIKIREFAMKILAEYY
tara:strand:- start:7 stop:867 length:861 start_codon:yes stop_codon:yes gene_type:complete